MTSADAVSTGRSVARSLGASLGRFGVAIALVVAFVIFSVLQPQGFLNFNNVVLILSSVATLGLLALAATSVLAAGEFDLSIGYTTSMAVVLGAGLVAKQGLSWPVAFLLCLVAGCVIGLVNGYLVGYLGLPAFVVTLATGSLLQGAEGWYSGDERIFFGIPPDFTEIGQGRWLGIPGPVFVFAVFAIAVWVMLDKLRAGRHIYARGANKKAAVMAGLSIRRSALLAFTIAGLASAAAGVILVSSVGSASTDLGVPYLLPAYAAAFLGFVTFRPGQFNVWGTIAGVLLLGTISNGFVQVGLPTWTAEVFEGLILLGSVLFSVQRTRSGTRRGTRVPTLQPADKRVISKIDV
jgi:ribose transport system permease protein